MHEWEARVRHIESILNQLMEALAKLQDQVGLVQQQQQMQRQPSRGDARIIRVAKNGASAIAAMSGTTPGSGTVTFYDFTGTSLVSAETGPAYNLHPTATVSANAWLITTHADGKALVVWEPC